MDIHNKSLSDIVRGKNVLFITTKNLDYIRNTQEIAILSENAAGVEIVGSSQKNYILRVLSVWKQITKKTIKRNDLIFAGFAPQLVIPFLGYKFKNKFIVADFFISVYDTLIHDRKWFRDNTVIAKLCHRLDSITLAKADYVITDTKAHARYFAEEFCKGADIFETIYLKADETIYYPRVQMKREDLKDKCVVLYFGSILPLQGVDVVLQTITLFQGREDVVFEIVGPIGKKYCKPVQDNVRYIEWLPQKELAEHIANADVCLAGHFAADIDKANRTIPGKAYIYEMMHRPMILGDSEANHELFTEDENHYFTRMGDSRQLYETIQRVIENSGKNRWNCERN